MPSLLKKKTLTTTLAVLSAIAWSGTALACSAEPLLGSICIMAGKQLFSNVQYMPAMGQKLMSAQNVALQALIGDTYSPKIEQGFFYLPDLRGRVVIGAGAATNSTSAYVVGAKGGLEATTLTAQDLPPHIHLVKEATLIANAKFDIKSLRITKEGLNAANGEVRGSDLDLKVSSKIGTLSVPTTGASFGATASTVKPYNPEVPDVTMHAGVIGGKATVRFTQDIDVDASASTASISTLKIAEHLTEQNTGLSKAFENRMPYLAMYYYIAISGLYPASE
ncbi:phage tail protein [Massilia sp. erpn]|uniref:phage tail protein n=1 Tax=Massilia sp. erpn TaxID=2738142 RepID=UPI002105A715|nr:tail fiber protein [Massilia sp. erpn]UTY57614.1 hypothetical protein HPQ68_10755 [Massilia sp. erpn]